MTHRHGVRRDRQFRDMEPDEVRVIYYEARGFWLEMSYPMGEFTPRKRMKLLTTGGSMEFELMGTSIPPFKYVYREVVQK